MDPPQGGGGGHYARRCRHPLLTFVRRGIRMVGSIYHPGLPGNGIAAVLQFRDPDPLLFDWTATPCLQRGSLVCISTTGLLSTPYGPAPADSMFWGVVVDRDPRLLRSGLVVVDLLLHTPKQLHDALTCPSPVPDVVMAENPLCFPQVPRAPLCRRGSVLTCPRPAVVRGDGGAQGRCHVAVVLPRGGGTG